MSNETPGFVVSTPVGGPSRSGPSVHLTTSLLRVAFVVIRGRHDAIGNPYDLLMFQDASEHDHPELSSKDLQGWARGEKYTAAYMQNRRPAKHLPTALLRESEISLVFGLQAFVTTATRVHIELTPVLDGDPKAIEASTFDIELTPDEWIHGGAVELQGKLPDDVGEHDLELKWACKTAGFSFGLGGTKPGPEGTEHRIYTIHDVPLDPTHHFESYSEEMKVVDVVKHGTLTGTPQRFERLMSFLRDKGEKKAAHPSRTEADREAIYWKVHVGINDTPRKPPFFNGARDDHIRPGGKGKRELPLEDQWLAWVDHSKEDDYWNVCSCIGHVQLAKTMLAAIGLPVQRTWVLPHTDIAPDGTPFKKKFEDSDRHILGDFSKGHKKKALKTTSRDDRGESFQSHLVLVEKSGEWEDFEACMITPAGKFLTGGFSLDAMKGSGFAKKKGFDSAGELLRWWATTTHGGFKRFQCWASNKNGTRRYWDREGNFYSRNKFKQIGTKKKHVPPPTE